MVSESEFQCAYFRLRIIRVLTAADPRLEPNIVYAVRHWQAHDDVIKQYVLLRSVNHLLLAFGNDLYL